MMSRTGQDKFVYPKDVDAFGFDWGRLALTVAPEVNGAETLFGRRGRPAVRPGPYAPQPSRRRGDHLRHLRQWRADGRGRGGQPDRPEGRSRLHDLRAGKPLPLDAQHRVGPMQLFVVYSPAGPELGLRDLPDFRIIPRARKGA